MALFSNGLGFDENLAAQQSRPSAYTKKYGEGLGGPLTEHHLSTGPESMDELFTALSDPDFSTFVEDSYKRDEGYSIRINPISGKKKR